MTVPGFQKFMLPLLEFIRDEKVHTNAEAIEEMAAIMRISEEDRRELQSSGKSRFENRVLWAITHLRKAGLLESPARARIRVTERGLRVLAEKAQAINMKFLMQFEEYRQFRKTAGPEVEEEKEVEKEGEQTPEERLESIYQTLRQTLAHDLLDRLRKGSPKLFERIVLDLLVAMGYGGSLREAAEAVGRVGDEGIDGIIKEDKLGLDAVYIQAKRWEGTVGRPVVQGFAGSLEGAKARKGVLITTSEFSRDAREYVGKIEKKIVLIDGEELARLMIENNVGVAEVTTYPIKRVDLDYFEED